MQFESAPPSVDPWDAFFRNTSISKSTHKHISKVYQTLAVMITLAAIGSVVQVQYQIGGFFTFIASLGVMFWFILTPYVPNDQANETKRSLMVFASAFFSGISLGPLLNMAYQTHGDLFIATAFGATALVFACFSAASYYATKRHLMYLTGLILTASTMLFFLSLASIFNRSPFLDNLILYLGIMVFSGYVIFDTQMMIVQADMGYKDVPFHALNLFVDFVQLFIRILRLLSKKQKKNDD